MAKVTHHFIAKLRDGAVHRKFEGNTTGTRTIKDALAVAADLIEPHLRGDTYDRVEIIIRKPR